MFKVISISLLSLFLFACDKKEEAPTVEVKGEAGVIQVTDGAKIDTKGVKIQGKDGSVVMNKGKIEIKGANGEIVKLGKGGKVDIKGALGEKVELKTGKTKEGTKTCASGNCKQACAGAMCSFTCAGGECAQSCKESAFCSFTCAGGNCSQSCAKDASCTFTCAGGDCKQEKKSAKKFVATCTGGDCKKS